MLEKGIRGEQTVVVTKELSAKEMGSGELMVYATPAMIALMEKTAYTSVASELEEGMGTVGTLMNVSHIAASPMKPERLVRENMSALLWQMKNSRAKQMQN